MTLHQLALGILAGTIKNKDILESPNWQYRKGKGPNDINKSIQKARKVGMGKFEFELEMFELYLGDILKKKC